MQRYVDAMLVDHFHLTLEEIGELTDRQVLEIYLHSRDQQGTLVPPEGMIAAASGQTTLEKELANLDTLKRVLKLPESNYQECVAKLKAKFAGMEAERASKKASNKAKNSISGRAASGVSWSLDRRMS